MFCFFARESCPLRQCSGVPILKDSKHREIFDKCVFEQQIRPSLKLRGAVGKHCHCYKQKGSAEKPAHAHLRCLKIINNDVDIIVIMYF